MRDMILIGPIHLDVLRCEVGTPDKTAHLTPLEIWLLRYLAEHVNTTCSVSQISSYMWGDADYVGAIGIIKVLIHHIQEKVEPDPMHPTYLLFLPGEGYKLVIHDQEPRLQTEPG